MPKAPEELVEINTRRAVHLERLKTSNQNEFLPFFNTIRSRYREFFLDDLEDLSRARLNRKLDALNKGIAATYENYHNLWVQQIKELSEADLEFQHKALGTTTNLEFDLPTAKQVEVAIFSRPLSVEGIHGGLLLDEFFDDISQRDITRIERVIRLGFGNGETTPQVARRIFGTLAQGNRDGELQKIRRSAEAIARTGLQHASQMTRQSLYEANRKVIKGYQWISTLDSRTSAICTGLSGRFFPLGKGPVPPAHPNCRSTTVPTFDSRFAFLRQDATQSSRGDDGVEPVDANLNYFGWLKTQNKEFQDSAIGPKWAKLMRDGGLSSERFSELRLNKDFSPATLKDVKRLEPVAFQKAGINA